MGYNMENFYKMNLEEGDFHEVPPLDFLPEWGKLHRCKQKSDTHGKFLGVRDGNGKKKILRKYKRLPNNSKM